MYDACTCVRVCVSLYFKKSFVGLHVTFGVSVWPLTMHFFTAATPIDDIDGDGKGHKIPESIQPIIQSQASRNSHLSGSHVS